MIRAIFQENGDRILVPSSWTRFTFPPREFRQLEPGRIEVRLGNSMWSQKLATPPLQFIHGRPLHAERHNLTSLAGEDTDGSTA